MVDTLLLACARSSPGPFLRALELLFELLRNFARVRLLGNDAFHELSLGQLAVRIEVPPPDYGLQELIRDELAALVQEPFKRYLVNELEVAVVHLLEQPESVEIVSLHQVLLEHL